MAMPESKKVFVMEFVMDSGKTLALRINAPKDDLQRTAVETVMDTIIEKQAFMLGLAVPESIGDAYYIETTTTQVI